MYHGFNYAANYSHLLQDDEGEKKKFKGGKQMASHFFNTRSSQSADIAAILTS